MTNPSQSLAFWNSQLENAKTVPDHDSWPGRYEEMSKEAIAAFGEPEKLAVGTDDMQALWRTLCGRPTHRLIFIHGGYWRRFAANDFAFPVAAAAAADAAFYNVDYRLMPGATMGEVVADAVAACERALEGAERAVIVGHSAGGHLAVEAGLRTIGVPTAVVGISGLYDLVPIRRCFIQDELNLSLADAAAYSPQDRAAEARCPVHIYAGADETVEFRRHSAMLYDALAEAGRETSLTFSAERNHSQIVTDLADPGSALSRHVAALINGTPATPA